MKIPVQPFTRVQVKQKVGNYGPFNVNTKHYEITCIDLETEKKCMHSRGVDNSKIRTVVEREVSNWAKFE